MLSDAILKMAMQYVLTYVAVRQENEVVLVKPPIVHTRLLFLLVHQITMTQMLGALTEPGDILNLFCTPFIRFLTSTLVQLKVLTTQEDHA